MIYLLPSLISIIQGFLLMTVLIPKDVRPAMPLFVLWGSLLGMATTALLTLSSFLFFDKLIPAYAIAVNITATMGLFFLARRNNLASPFGRNNWDRIDLIGLHLILLCHVPIILHAMAHPPSDASLAHQVLLPLINVWAWSFSPTPDHAVIIITACRISLVLSGIIFFGSKHFWGKKPSWLLLLGIAPVLLVMTLAAQHYKSLLPGAWLLSALLAFKLFLDLHAKPYLRLAAISLIVLSITQTNGAFIAIIMLVLFATTLLIRTCFPGR